ncbi:D-alanyl-D-alanine carboxypeptidase [Nonomuraea solani]|uniref:D-alanyl-D-alanine carboxypeptidase n=1 Tax=Nonomuraea solani TaxID=1144553 RepID=A0A1H6F3A1_9ACTN|nr:D-alanyl-D-alanine carboxypeptidase [Nonomuraea solani]
MEDVRKKRPKGSAMAAHENVQQVLDWSVAEVGIPGIVTDVKDGDRTWFGTAGVADIKTASPRDSSGKAFTSATLLAPELSHR